VFGTSRQISVLELHEVPFRIGVILADQLGAPDNIIPLFASVDTALFRNATPLVKFKVDLVVMENPKWIGSADHWAVRTQSAALALLEKPAGTVWLFPDIQAIMPTVSLHHGGQPPRLGAFQGLGPVLPRGQEIVFVEPTRFNPGNVVQGEWYSGITFAAGRPDLGAVKAGVRGKLW
jgi:hypothetical protein